MANEFGANVNVGGANQFAAAWHLILRMLKAGWWMRASSDGATKVVSDNPASHTAFPLSNVGAGGAAAHVTAVDDHPYGKLLTVTNVSGLVSPTVTGGQSEGNYLTLSGSAGGADDGTLQIYEVLSATSCKVLMRGGSPAVDGGNITWQEKTVLPGAPSYSLGAAQWWACLEGMETYQFRFKAPFTGEFVPGELVTQSTTLATGEVVGMVYDAVTDEGWIIVQPRSGAFNGTQQITGSTSLATITPYSLLKYRRQIVFTHGSTSQHYTGSVYYAMLRDDGGAEAAELYSAKASHVACTATVAPGFSKTAGNRQVNPAVANSFYVLRCQINATHDGATDPVHADGIFHASTSGPNGLVQIAAANVMPRSGRAADGTWWAFYGNTAYTGGNLLGQFRIDNGEPGEPEVILSLSNGANSVDSRDAAYGGFNNMAGTFTSDYFTSVAQEGCWRRVVRRAVGSAGGGPFYEAPFTAVSASGRSNATGASAALNLGGTPRCNSHPAAVAPTFREPVGVRDGFGGRLRWMHIAPYGSAYQTGAGKRLICISSYNTGAGDGAVFIGPWDQTNDPVQS